MLLFFIFEDCNANEKNRDIAISEKFVTQSVIVLTKFP